MKTIEAEVVLLKKIMAVFNEAKRQGVKDPGKKIIQSIKARKMLNIHRQRRKMSLTKWSQD